MLKDSELSGKPLDSNMTNYDGRPLIDAELSHSYLLDVGLKSYKHYDSSKKREIKCKAKGPITENSAYVYLMESRGTDLFKIGRTVNLMARKTAFSSCWGGLSYLVAATKFSYAPVFEKAFHALCSPAVYQGEWFKLHPDDVSAIASFFRKNGGVGEEYLSELSRTTANARSRKKARKRSPEEVKALDEIFERYQRKIFSVKISAGDEFL